MVSLPDGKASYICGECGEEFMTAEQLGEHVEHVHREQEQKGEGENPTNIGPGITDRFESA
jgi:DNA-directed RNA polymerase subunit RPC12/RpoP